MNQETVIVESRYAGFCKYPSGHVYRSTRPRDWNSVVLITEGTLSYQSSRGNYRFPADTVFVVPYNEWELVKPEGDNVSYIYADYFCDPPASEMEFIHIEHPNEYCELLENLLDVRQTHAPGWQFRCMEMLYALLYRFSRDQAHCSGSDRKHQKIRPAMLKIARDFAEPLDCAELAERCSVSISSLNRLFRETTGRSPMQYLADTRIEYAKNELTRGTLSISELAVRCGFADIYTFSHAFKRATGTAPSEWCTK